jgi:hypothetical protein
MKRKLLAVGISTVSVILLILASLTNVVGYQSIKSDGVNDSPLFSVRTQRATNQQQNTITSQYLGKGRYTIPFPLRDNRTELIRKFIDVVRRMDDATFNRFIDSAVKQLNHKENFKYISVMEFIKEIRQLRESKQNIIPSKDKNDSRLTYLYNFYPTACWFPGCLLMFVIGAFLVCVWVLILTIGFAYIALTQPPSSWGPGCQP